MDGNKSLTDLISKATVHNERAEAELFLRSFLRFLFLAIPLFGLVLNAMALKVLSRRATQDQYRFNHGAGLPLAAMTIADQLCLSAYFCWMVVFSEWGLSITFNATTKTVICKTLLYVVHSTSAFSLWCWTLMSYFRYFAVYKPVKYQTMTSEPRLAVAIVVGVCLALETWILPLAVFDPTNNVCMENLSRVASSVVHVTEMTWTYFLPMVLIAMLDLKVLCRRASDTEVTVELRPGKDSLHVSTRLQVSATMRKTSPRLITKQNPTLRKEAVQFLQEKRSSSERRDSKTTQVNMLYRCLYIALFDLTMNLPSYCLRLYAAIFHSSPISNEQISYYVESISELLYFSQFCMNSIYLAAMVYQSPADSRRNTLSASYRSKRSTMDSAYSSNKSFEPLKNRSRNFV